MPHRLREDHGEQLIGKDNSQEQLEQKEKKEPEKDGLQGHPQKITHRSKELC